MYILMPTDLTAENGAKAKFSGEFTWDEEIPNPFFGEEDEPEILIQKHTVPWDVVKRMYRRIVEEYGVTDD